MEQKTKISAEAGKHDLIITREFDLPVELLFKAYDDPELVEQWMGTKVLKMENERFGNYQFETLNENGKKVFGAIGVIHEHKPNQKIIRTFEMENTPFGVQLEIYEFESINNNSSQLKMHVIYETIVQRDQVLNLPFAQGINMAHNRLQEIVNKLR